MAVSPLVLLDSGGGLSRRPRLGRLPFVDTFDIEIVMRLLKLPFLFAFAALTGCAVGRSTYTVRPYTDVVTGQMVCCEATVSSSRDVGSVSVHAAHQPDGSYTLDFSEHDVSASKPIAAQSVEVNGISSALSNTAAAIIKLSP